MKRLLLILPITFILYACPFESTVGLESGPVEPVDTSLMGYWYGIVKDGSDFFGIEALDIRKQTDSTYNIIRYGKAAKGDIILPDTAYFTGFTSWIDDQRYMNIEGEVVIFETKRGKAPELKKQRVYYAALLTLRHDTLQVRTIKEDFTIAARRGFRLPIDFKQTVSTLLSEKKEIYDDLYSLSYKLQRR